MHSIASCPLNLLTWYIDGSLTLDVVKWPLVTRLRSPCSYKILAMHSTVVCSRAVDSWLATGVLGMTLNCIHIFIVTGSFLYWCVMRPASQRFFLHGCICCIHLRILIVFYLATFLGTNGLSVLMCRKAINQSINQATGTGLESVFWLWGLDPLTPAMGACNWKRLFHAAALWFCRVKDTVLRFPSDQINRHLQLLKMFATGAQAGSSWLWLCHASAMRFVDWFRLQGYSWNKIRRNLSVLIVMATSSKWLFLARFFLEWHILLGYPSRLFNWTCSI